MGTRKANFHLAVGKESPEDNTSVCVFLPKLGPLASDEHKQAIIKRLKERKTFLDPKTKILKKKKICI